MAIIYLIRHGQASFGQSDYDCLSDLGVEQATHLGKSLTARVGHFDKIIRGSMLRHQQTANACLNAMPQTTLAPEVDDRWNEYDHQNILAQLDPDFATADEVKTYIMQQADPKKALEKVLNKAFARWISGRHNSDYAESWPTYQSRIKEALADLASNLDHTHKIAVFSSGGPIALVSQHLLGVPAQNLMQLNWVLLNCGVTKLLTNRDGIVLSSLNDHSAFEGQHKHLITYK